MLTEIPAEMGRARDMRLLYAGTFRALCIRFAVSQCLGRDFSDNSIIRVDRRAFSETLFSVNGVPILYVWMCPIHCDGLKTYPPFLNWVGK